MCVDILDALSTLKTDGSSFEAREMNLYREDNAVDDLLVDAVIVVRSDLATDTQGNGTCRIKFTDIHN